MIGKVQPTASVFWTPLLSAMRQELYDLAKRLIEYGADVEMMESGTKQTPLLYSVKYGNNAFAKYLVHIGANLDN
jgi:ankyrin repeat protein